MALYSKKLHYIKNNTQYDADLYTSKEELLNAKGYFNYYNSATGEYAYAKLVDSASPVASALKTINGYHIAKTNGADSSVSFTTNCNTISAGGTTYILSLPPELDTANFIATPADANAKVSYSFSDDGITYSAYTSYTSSISATFAIKFKKAKYLRVRCMSYDGYSTTNYVVNINRYAPNVGTPFLGGYYISYDETTGLALLSAGSDNGIPLNWENAYAYCNNLTTNGYTNWRLPTNSTELFSVLKDAPGIKTATNYWTAQTWSTSAGNYAGAGSIASNDSTSYIGLLRTNYCWVRPVRSVMIEQSANGNIPAGEYAFSVFTGKVSQYVAEGAERTLANPVTITASDGRTISNITKIYYMVSSGQFIGHIVYVNGTSTNSNGYTTTSANIDTGLFYAFGIDSNPGFTVTVLNNIVFV